MKTVTSRRLKRFVKDLEELVRELDDDASFEEALEADSIGPDRGTSGTVSEAPSAPPPVFITIPEASSSRPTKVIK